MKTCRCITAFALLTFTLTLTLTGCESKTTAAPVAAKAAYPAVVTLTGPTMGTRYNIKIRVEDATSSAKAAGLTAKVDALLAKVNAQMSTYDPESELSRFNRAEGSEPFTVSRDTAEVVKLALTIAGQTEGAFDVTLGPLIKAWGFDGKKTDKRPDDETLANAKALVGYRMLHIDGKERLVKDKDGVYVNLSAVAKGWGVDKVAALIKNEAFASFMVEVGGEVYATGKNVAGVPWTIGINVPRSDADPQAVQRAVPVDGKGLATSGNYRNYFEAGGKRYGHIIDARSGEPVQTSLVSASILAENCAVADALATSALALGEVKMRALLKKHYPGVEAMFITDDGGQLTTTTTVGFPPSPGS